MTQIVTSGSMRRQGKPIHGTSSEAPGNRKSRATDRMLLPTRRLCLTLHVKNQSRGSPVKMTSHFGVCLWGRGEGVEQRSRMRHNRLTLSSRGGGGGGRDGDTTSGSGSRGLGTALCAAQREKRRGGAADCRLCGPPAAAGGGAGAHGPAAAGDYGGAHDCRRLP